jgi:hypothetical protein
MSDLVDSRTDEILEGATEAEQHGLYARLTRWEDDRYAVEISPILQPVATKTSGIWSVDRLGTTQACSTLRQTLATTLRT